MGEPASTESLSELETLLAALRAREEQRFAPVRFAYIESLVRRASAQNAAVAERVRARASAALKDYRKDFSEAQRVARHALNEAKQQYPDSGPKLEQLFESCCFTQMNREMAALQSCEVSTSLAELVTYVSKPSPGLEELNREPSFDDILRQQEHRLVNTGEGAGDTSMHYLRESLVKRNADKLVSRLIREIPDGAGPLNPHKLIVQSLASMRDLSPHYLNRFVAYIDTLLWLERAGK